MRRRGCGRQHARCCRKSWSIGFFQRVKPRLILPEDIWTISVQLIVNSTLHPIDEVVGDDLVVACLASEVETGVYKIEKMLEY